MSTMKTAKIVCGLLAPTSLPGCSFFDSEIVTVCEENWPQPSHSLPLA